MLQPAQDELHELGGLISYQPSKEGKKVTAVRFQISKPVVASESETTKKVLVLPPATKPPTKGGVRATVSGSNVTAGGGSDEQQLPLAQRITTRLLKLRLTEAQVQYVLAYLGDDEARATKLLKLTHPLLHDMATGSKSFDNLGGVTINLLKTEFPGLYPTARPGDSGGGLGRAKKRSVIFARTTWIRMKEPIRFLY